jgi:hypothetical protein
VLEQSAEPFAKTLAAQFSVGGEWQQFDVPAKVEQDYAKSPPRVSLRLGFLPQTIENRGRRAAELWTRRQPHPAFRAPRLRTRVAKPAQLGAKQRPSASRRFAKRQ